MLKSDGMMPAISCIKGRIKVKTALRCLSEVEQIVWPNKKVSSSFMAVFKKTL